MNKSPHANKLRSLLWLALLPGAVCLATGCGDDVTKKYYENPDGSTIDVSTAPDDVVANLDVVSEITNVKISSPPVVSFSVSTAEGTPITGLASFWDQNNRFIRFTIDKLVPGTSGDPDSWVAYVLDNGEPDYDTGSSVVDNGDGTYTFTFLTDVTNVPGVTYEPTLTTRVAGQIGQSSLTPLEDQNLWLDFVPNGSPVTNRRDIAVMESCNECHSDLVFHGRRFKVQYCVNCHNPGLANGEGNFSFMIHRIHAAGDFTTLDGGASFGEVTYPQDLRNCRKCHKETDPATPQAENWFMLPNIAACDGCHNVFATNTHSGPMLNDNEACTLCHGVGEEYPVMAIHATTNMTPNNPQLPEDERHITYEMGDVSVDGGSNEVTIQFQILSDGVPLDLTSLPMDLVDPATMEAFSYPTLLLAYAMPQDGIDEPADFNNMGQRGAQALSVNLGNFMPIEMASPAGLLTFDAMDGFMTATITDPDSQFPMGSSLRAVGLQGYLQQDLDIDGSADVSLHALSVMTNVAGDAARRMVVDSAKCSNCHEWFEGHGGNRVLGDGSIVICTMCHVPNQSSSGRTVTDPMARGLDVVMADAIAAGTLSSAVDPNDPLTYVEDAQNLKDLIHGIHSSDDRTRPYQHVRGPSRQAYYDWSEVTFPRGASTSQCLLCHMEGSYELPLPDGVLATTVRTTSVDDGLDPTEMAVETAFQDVPNASDWVNTPTADSCFYCHTSSVAFGHMMQNGALLSNPIEGDGPQANRMNLGSTIESCALCHGPGGVADLDEVHADD